jgi:hypothetical protein
LEILFQGCRTSYHLIDFPQCLTKLPLGRIFHKGEQKANNHGLGGGP